MTDTTEGKNLGRGNPEKISGPFVAGQDAWIPLGT